MGDALRKRLVTGEFQSSMQEALLNLLVTADFIRGRMEASCAAFGITASQYNVLRILRGHPPGHSRCEIARRMLERAPDVTRLVDRLERQGLVERDRDDQDRRLSITRITAAGRDLLARMEPMMQESERFFADRVSLRDRGELSRICEGIYDEPEEPPSVR
ncbi:MAG TPA: MarR family transcriptional regulator [Thermoanaerobaculia bacterium]